MQVRAAISRLVRRLELAKAYWIRATARHLLREMDGILLYQPALGVLVEQVEEFRRIDASSAQRGSACESPLPRAELRLIPYQQMHLTFSEIGDRFISRNTVNTQVGSIYRKLGVSSRRDAVQHLLSVQEQVRTRNGNCASGRPNRWYRPGIDAAGGHLDASNGPLVKPNMRCWLDEDR
jgi:hypothetical protein